MKILALASFLIFSSAYAQTLKFDCALPTVVEAHKAAFSGVLELGNDSSVVDFSLSSVDLKKSGEESELETIAGVEGEVSVKIYPESSFGSIVTSITVKNEAAKIIEMKINLGLDAPLNSYVMTAEGWKYRTKCLLID